VRALIDESTGVEGARRVGTLYDTAEAEGREYFVRSGVEIIRPSPQEFIAFNDALKSTQEEMLATLEAKGKKARAFYARIRQLVGDTKA
jgi:TRAP-type transport system periplasmic protein